MHLHRLLSELERTGQAINTIANAVQQHPTAGQAGMQAVQSLVANLFYTEQHLATVVGRALRRPLPTPSTEAVGAWAGQMERLNLPDPNLPDTLGTLVGRLQQQVQEVAGWVQRLPVQPAAGSMGNAGGVPNAPGAPEGNKTLGWILYGVATLGGLASVWATYQADKQKVRNFGINPDDLTPQDAQNQAQAILDHELPGTTVKVVRTPDGSWASSVKKGNETLAREVSHDPAKAASSATEQAISLETARRESLERATLIGGGKG